MMPANHHATTMGTKTLLFSWGWWWCLLIITMLLGGTFTSCSHPQTSLCPCICQFHFILSLTSPVRWLTVNQVKPDCLGWLASTCEQSTLHLSSCVLIQIVKNDHSFQHPNCQHQRAPVLRTPHPTGRWQPRWRKTSCWASSVHLPAIILWHHCSLLLIEDYWADYPRRWCRKQKIAPWQDFCLATMQSVLFILCLEWASVSNCSLSRRRRVKRNFSTF